MTAWPLIATEPNFVCSPRNGIRLYDDSTRTRIGFPAVNGCPVGDSTQTFSLAVTEREHSAAFIGSGQLAGLPPAKVPSFSSLVSAWFLNHCRKSVTCGVSAIPGLL